MKDWTPTFSKFLVKGVTCLREIAKVELNFAFRDGKTHEVSLFGLTNPCIISKKASNYSLKVTTSVCSLM